MSNLVRAGAWAVKRILNGVPHESVAAAVKIDDLPEPWPTLIGAMGRRNGIDARSCLDEALSNLDPDQRKAAWIALLSEDGASFAPPAADAWKVYTLADAYAPRPPLEFIVDGLLPVPSLSVVYGAPASLKTMLAQDMVMNVAAGKPWLLPRPGAIAAPKRTTQSAAMWIDFDNGSRRMHERFEAIGRAYELPIDTPIKYFSMPNPRLDASDDASIAELITRVRLYEARLVVIDNLGLVEGGTDENGPDMSHVMGNLRMLAEESQSAIVLIHHQRKSSMVSGRAGDALRGHSSIEAALDLALIVEREDTSAQIEVRSTKTRDVDVKPFGALFTFEHNPGTSELATARFFGTSVEDNNSDGAIQNAIVEVLTGSAMNQTEAVKLVREILNGEPGVNRVRQILNRMARDGKIQAKNGDRNTVRYSAQA